MISYVWWFCKNTGSMDRGPHIRLGVELDLDKPLLSIFELNGRVWDIGMKVSSKFASNAENWGKSR